MALVKNNQGNVPNSRPTTSTGRPTTYSVDDAEKQKFMAAFKELNPDWKPDEDSILYDEDAPYKGFLYQKALGRF